MKLKMDFSPASVPGLALWLKADAGVYQDTGTTSPAVAGGDQVGHWLDQSANGNNATFSTGDAAKGYLATGAVNGHNAIGFDGSVQASLTLDRTITVGPFTLYAVGKRANGSNWMPLAHHATPGVLVIPYSDNNVYVTDTQGNSISHPFPWQTSVIGTRTIWLSGGGAQEVHFAATGMPEVAVGVLNHNLDYFDINQVGGRGSASQWNGTGNLYCEVLLFSKDVPGSDPVGDLNILKYLKKRWGITIP